MLSDERAQRSRAGVAAAVDLARRHGLWVTEPTVLADLFSLMVHLKPAPDSLVKRFAARGTFCMLGSLPRHVLRHGIRTGR